jgi:nitrite reductase/ring-hydroxylating ferredoxin subunit
MSFFSRILGLSRTARPAAPDCWRLDGTEIRLDLGRAAELKAPGTALRLEGPGLATRVLVVHDAGDRFYALVNRCAHFGRRLDLLESGELMCCSVNRSRFDLEGRKLSGPAKGDAQPLPVVREGDILRVDLAALAGK